MSEILNKTLEKMRAKYEAGVKEHGGLDEAPNDLRLWIEEIQAEALDTVNYCEKILAIIPEERK